MRMDVSYASINHIFYYGGRFLSMSFILSTYMEMNWLALFFYYAMQCHGKFYGVCSHPIVCLLSTIL